jgi:hypothetical protein
VNDKVCILRKEIIKKDKNNKKKKDKKDIFLCSCGKIDFLPVFYSKQ